MTRPRNFFRVESTELPDVVVIRELVIDYKRMTRDRYRWLFVTDDFPTDDYNMAKRFTWKESIDFLNQMDDSAEAVDFRRTT